MKSFPWVFLLLLSTSFTLSGQTTVTFVLEELPVEKSLSSSFGLRGDLAPLSWDTTLPLDFIDGKYTVRVTFQTREKPLEFKFVSADTLKQINWETIENRSLELTGKTQLYAANWDELPYRDPATLPLLTVDELQKDFAIIETVFREMHPGSYRYLSEEELDDNLDRLREKFSEPLSIGRAYLALSELTASVRCGHTGSPFYNQGAAVNSVIHGQADKLPFTFRWLGERMIVVEDATEQQLLPRGTEILRINGLPAVEVLQALRPYVASDGPAVDPIDGILSLRGYPFRYDAFDVFYPLVYPIPASGLRVDYQTPAGQPTAAVLTTVTRKERTMRLKDRYPDFPLRPDDLWGLEILENNTAVLTLGDFSGTGVNALALNPPAFYVEAFKALKAANIEHLIVDVRENQGGNDNIVKELFTYFPFSYCEEEGFEGRMRYRTFPEALKPLVKTWGDDPWYFAPKPEGIDAATGDYLFPNEFRNMTKNKVKKNAFRGQVSFLTGRINASLGFYLARAVRNYKLGTLVGETTGGSLRGISGGQLLFLRLPNTGLELDFPVLGGFATSPQPFTGVPPDVLEAPTPTSIAKGEDLVLARALQLIAAPKN